MLELARSLQRLGLVGLFTILLVTCLGSGCATTRTHRVITLTNGSPEFIRHLELQGWTVIDETPWYEKEGG